MGRLATGMAGGVMSAGARRLISRERPALRDLMLTPGNLSRVATEMAQLRGAAMKLGQLLSMDAGQLLPAELSVLLDRLRADADTMPGSQLRAVLAAEWGADWQNQFADFNFRPMAAASIGQVHRAVTHDGRALAIKVQYPGVARSIDSDIDNVATLLRLTRLVPAGLDLAPLLAEAKQQLHAEADYGQEAAAMTRYAAWLERDPHLVVPTVDTGLSTERVLAMPWLSGEPVDRLVHSPATVRNEAVRWLLELLFRELFEFNCVQTDPNFANFLYDASARHLVLLDFGATRDYGAPVVSGYRALLTAALDDDAAAMADAACQIGYFGQAITPAQRDAVLALFRIATEPLRHEGVYDFSRSDIAQRIRQQGMALSLEQGYWHSPPMDALFLHRKLAGLYLLACRLQAQVDLRPLRRWLVDDAAAQDDARSRSAGSSTA
ncbi:AarF/ABC1/UbiB kinase family protein [Natronospirillum operosum]|uniref:AarF/ABC1/UbiB kinase family protein n=2 Tax=Natronospirillum operosum TaxID=2759953 RepID=A0A4Z0WDX9_9GAMM|nr:AarF/ABC1/UbiB kinase family protein [Natronospirillum operosum]